MEKNGVQYLSYSQMSMFIKCGEQWRRRYIMGDKIPPNIAMLKGSCIHKGIEFNGSQKINSKVDLPKQDIVDFTVATFEEETKGQEVELTEEEKAEGKLTAIGESKDRLVKIATLYAEQVSPNIQPIAVEERVMIEIPNQKPILAILDLLDETHAVHDFKYSGKSKTQKTVDDDLQFSIYSVACKEKTGEYPSKMVMDVLVDTKEPKHQAIETHRDESSYVKVVRLAGAIENAINSSIFLPAKSGEWWCSEKFCGYWHTCKYVQSSIMF